ncbi:unnamed protein product [Sphagnum jensenii]|uniref:MATH domain-containing protein n=1 Tax=Sphagnum jensenii TaxID=128206 RepID=A0ABP1C2B0_9BRYO
MACHSRGETGGSVLSEAPMSSKVHSSSESISEWRSREQLEPSPPSTSPAYWDTDEDDDFNSSSMTGPKLTDLYGKFTWKIENFSEISKRELRSNVFEVGGYKWYILVYPQGCDVCNHLSLFLCVADYDKLLPGWSHFAQFTIAVVNKDPKKSKYSDTLHRFCKKEHDWGWKKFMELSKVLDGFTVADTLVIKAQVQVIRENPHRPFRCLDCQYRRELVRVYLTNVEGICRRFVEEKREKLGKLMEDTPRWTSFRAFWSAVEDSTRWRLAREKTDVILKAVVKRFFNEKEVTSTLVMDALYSGCKALDYQSRNKKEKMNGVDMEETTDPVVWVDKDAFVLAGDVLLLLERVVSETLPPYKDDKGPQNRTKDGTGGDDVGKDTVECDERRLTELGRRTVEMFVLAHLYTNRVEVAYREAVALKRQEELIREEEAAGQAETELRAKREAAEREKRSKKKQAKQRRKDRKEKDKEAEEKRVRLEQEDRQRKSDVLRPKERLLKEHEILLLTPADIGEEEDDLSGMDTVDDVVGTLGPAIEDGDNDLTGWEREGSYGQSGMEVAGFSGAVLEEGLTQNGRGERKHRASALDDSSSTCSSDSLPSVRPSLNGSFNLRASLPDQNLASSRGTSRAENEAYDTVGQFIEAEGILQLTGMDLNGPGEASSSRTIAGVDAETVILSLKERVQWLEQRLFEKEEEVVLLQEQLSLFQHQMGLDGPSLHHRSLEDVPDPSRVGPIGTMSSIHAEESRSEVSTSSLLSDGAETPDAEKATNHQPRSSKEIPSMNGPSVVSNGRLAPVAGVEDTSSSTLALGPTRPTSALGLGAAHRPSGASSHPVPTLSQSMSATEHLGMGIEMDGGPQSNGSTPHSPPVTPSYRNAAAGKTRGSLGVTTYPVTLAPSVLGGVLAPIPGVQTSTSYMCSSNVHSVPNQVNTPATSSNFAPEQEQLHLQQGSLTKSQQQSPGHQMLLNQQDEVDQARPHLMDPRVQHENLAHQHHQQSHERLLHENGGLTGVRHAPNMVTLMESMNSGAVMSEEFPHLDIINDLLEDDQSFGMALTAMLQHPGGNPGFSNHHLSLARGHAGLHKLNQYGQLCADGMGAVSGIGVDGTEPGGMVDGDLSRLHGMEGNCNNNTGNNLTDSRRINTPFSHQPLGRLHNPHGGVLDGVLSHFWPIASAGMQAGSNSNNVRNGLDVHMGYPLVQNHHVPAPDCSGFSLGHNRYSVYAPAQQQP